MDDQDDELPRIVREIRQQTNDLIRTFDRLYLHLCGIRWERDEKDDESAPPPPDRP